MKTSKSAQKRLKLTRRKKVIFRPSRQNHFNAKQTGKTTQGKRHPENMDKSMKKVFEKVLSR